MKLVRCAVLVLACIAFLAGSTAASAATVRYTQYLDGGSTVTVDNASGWSQSEVSNLVLAADRSTRTGCPYAGAAKGLFKTGDRIFVNQNYIAWFDFTVGDGVTFPAPYSNNWARSGELAGFWTLNPNTRLFRYYRPAPGTDDGTGKLCTNWPANELIPGSASPTGGTYWWDAHAPGIEHFMVVRPTGGGADMWMAFHYAQSTPKSLFQRVLDGYEGPGGVHYKSSARMTSSQNTVDIYDNNDTIVTHYIEAELEYICRPGDILSVFKFKPNTPAAVISPNIFTYIWSAYSGQDMDGTSCDVAAGEQWPAESHVTKKPMWASSIDGLQNTWSAPPVGPGEWLQIKLEPACPDQAQNEDAFDEWPGSGSWLRWGVAPSLDRAEPRFQIINLGVPNSGSGTNADPFRLQMFSMLFAQERRDGTLGAGIVRQSDMNPMSLQPNKWYELYYAFSTSF